MVPKEWVSPPDYETADGELVDEHENDERSMMLRTRRSREQDHSSPCEVNEHTTVTNNSTRTPRAKGWRRNSDRNAEPRSSHPMLQDTSGRVIPPSERAPVP